MYEVGEGWRHGETRRGNMRWTEGGRDGEDVRGGGRTRWVKGGETEKTGETRWRVY